VVVRGQRIEPGTRIGDLEILHEIGRGAFGIVYLARDRLLERTVALKVLRAIGSATDRELDRVLAEARIVGRLQSPYVVTLYRVHPSTSHGWMFEMEYVEGGSLDRLLKEKGRIPLQRALEILKAVGRGLEVAHRADIVHGDIKPANILLDRASGAKVADFGLAQLLPDPGLASSLAGGNAGTPRYMAPEVVMGEPPRKPADFWGFGLLLYRFLAGRLPFDETNLNSLFVAIQNAPPPRLPAEAPRDLAALALHCLSKSPADRPRDFHEVSKRLSRAAHDRERSVFASAAAADAIIGREAELSRLTAMLDGAAASRGAAVLVTGEAGIGKTALVHAVAQEARRRNFRWVEVQATPVEGLLRPLLAELRDSGSSLGLSNLPPGDTELLSRFLNERGPPLGSREQVLWALERLILSMAAERPVAILVEDAHEAEPDDLLMVAALAQRLAPKRVFLGVTYRTHSDSDSTQGGRSPPSYQELSSRREFDHIDLDGLADDQILRILESAADARVPLDVARRILPRVGGNPLFAREMLQHLIEQEAVEIRKGAVEPGPHWERQDLPRRIRSLLTQRLRGLGADQRELLDIAAVDGLVFEGEAIAAVLDTPLLNVLRSLQTLFRERGLVEPRAAGYRFVHPLIRETILAETAPAMQSEVHRRLAEHLEKTPAKAKENPERIGRHWENAGEQDRARPYLLTAARHAFRRQETARVIDLYRRAGLAPEGVSVEHADDMFRLAACLADVGRLEEAESIMQFLRSHGSEELRLRALVWQARFTYQMRGPAAIDKSDLVAAARVLPQSLELALAHYNLGLVARYGGELDEAEIHFRHADEVYLELGRAEGHSDALDQLGTVARQMGRYEEARRLYEEAARVSREVGRATNAAMSDVNHALASLDLGEFEGIEARLETAIDTLRREGMEHVASHAALILVAALFARGEVAGARKRLADARRVLDGAKMLPARFSALFLTAELEMLRGDHAAAHQDLEVAHQVAEQIGMRKLVLLARALECQRRTLAGDAEGGLAAAGETLDLAAQKTGVDARSDAVTRLAETVLYGLPAAALAHPAVDDRELTRRAHLLVAAVRAYASPDGPVPPMETAAEEFLSVGGERAATLRVVGRWLATAALLRAKKPGALAQGLEALEAAETLGHLGQQKGLLALLCAQVHDPVLEERLSRLRAREKG